MAKAVGSPQVDAITAAVAQIDGVTASVEAYVLQVAAFITANKQDPVALQAAADKMVADVGRITTAITSTPVP